MPLPTAVTTVPLHGLILDGEGAPATGRVTFSMPGPLRDAGGNAVIGRHTFAADLDAAGEFELYLPATDDPDITPQGWTYTVSVSTNVWRERFSLEIPYGTEGTLELADLAPAVTPPAVITYVLASQLGVPGGVATLNEDGEVPDDQLPPGGGGGGTGTVNSLNGIEPDAGGELTVGAADVGADPAGTAAAAASAAQAAAISASDPVGSAAAAYTAAVSASDPAGSATNAYNAAVSASLQKDQNLNDVADKPTSRTNLGLGGSATLNVGTTAGTVAAADDSRITGALQRSTLVFYDDRGTLTAAAGDARLYNREEALVIVGVWASAGVAPVGADVIVDVHLNGTTIYSTQANRPTVPAGTNGGAISATPNTTALPVGGYLTVDIDQIGSGTAGGRLTVGIVVRRA